LNAALRFKKVEILRRNFHLGSITIFSFAVVEEFTQLAFPTRTFEVADMLFDLLGIGLLSSVAFRKFLVAKMQHFAIRLKENLLVEG